MLNRPVTLDVRNTPDVATPDPFTPGADPLGEALHFLRMDGAFYCRSELTAPWGLTLPPMPGCLWFHVVTSGRFRLEVPGGEAEWILPGDLALVTDGAGHVLRDEPGSPAPDILDLEREQVSERYELLRHGGGGAPSQLLCGAVRFDHPAARNLVDILPPVIKVAADDGWMQTTLALLAAEARELRPGGEAVITRLGDILVIQAIRAWIGTDPAARTGWLGALQDPQIGRALTLIHARSGARLDRRLARGRAGDVALGVRRALQRARRRAGDAVRHALAHARRPARAQGRGRDGRRARRPPRLPLRGGLRPRVQARDGDPARRRQARGVSVRTHYEDDGAGNPLVLLHPGLADSRAFERNVPGLAERFRVSPPRPARARPHPRRRRPDHLRRDGRRHDRLPRAGRRRPRVPARPQRRRRPSRCSPR